MKRSLLAAGFAVTVAGFVGSTWLLSFGTDPVTGEAYRAIPRDVMYQWSTSLAGILLAACTAYFLPLDWITPKTEKERIAGVVCLTALWCVIILSMARH